MVLMLNRNNVIIDICEKIQPVKKSKAGVTIPSALSNAQGYIGSDGEAIYAKIGSQFQPTFSDIASWVYVDEVPVNITPLNFKYEEGQFIPNTDAFPDTNSGLTSRTLDLEEIVLDMSSIIYG